MYSEKEGGRACSRTYPLHVVCPKREGGLVLGHIIHYMSFAQNGREGSLVLGHIVHRCRMHREGGREVFFQDILFTTCSVPREGGRACSRTYCSLHFVN